MVWFGSAGGGETWEYDGTVWTRRAPEVSPSRRSGHRMIYDSRRKRVLMFGGRREVDGLLLSDLWQYRGKNWSRVETAVEPHPRAAAGLAYDAERDRVVLFGGLSETGPLADTWLFDGESWRLVPGPRAPAARFSHQMAWDGFRRITVLHGGTSPDRMTLELNDVWEFDGEEWQPVDYGGVLKTTWEGSMVFDPLRRRMILFGGRTIGPRPGGNPRGEPIVVPTAATRLYDGQSWVSRFTRPTIPAGHDHAAAFDPERDLMVVQGGTRFGVPVDSTWKLFPYHDEDSDGLEDTRDNCPLHGNLDQSDSDGDGSGDSCDNCPETRNPWQRDLDRDGRGDACDDDDDGDGILDDLDVCPSAYVDGRPYDEILEGGGLDSDGDGTPDDCDLCPNDPQDDADGDGVCGDADNCPLADNTLQHDRNGDEAGDACQPLVDILSIAPLGNDALEAEVVFYDPDGDALSGEVRLVPHATLPDVLQRPGEECDPILEPDGVPNEGIIYGEPFGSPPALADADAVFGCGDGLQDFNLALGTCDEAEGGPFDLFVELRGAAPIPLCVRRVDGSGEPIDLTVWSFNDGRADLTSRANPVFVEPFEGPHLPRRVDLVLPPGPASFLLVIEAGDGKTPPVSDSIGFGRTGKTKLFLKAIREARAP